MTVKEIKSALADMKDDDEVKFISSYTDYEGWLSEREIPINKIVKGDAELIRDEYGRCFYGGW